MMYLLSMIALTISSALAGAILGLAAGIEAEKNHGKAEKQKKQRNRASPNLPFVVRQ